MEGTLLELWRWPVKGMAGERMPSVRVAACGVGGDRAHAVLSPEGRPLTGADVPALEQWSAAYPFNIGANVDPASPPHAIVVSPSGRGYVWGDPRLVAALEDCLGRPVRLHRDVDGVQDVPGTLLVAGPGVPGALRANVRVDVEVSSCAPGVELRLGRVRLEVRRTGPHGCVHARPIVNGRIAEGDPATT